MSLPRPVRRLKRKLEHRAGGGSRVITAVLVVVALGITLGAGIVMTREPKRGVVTGLPMTDPLTSPTPAPKPWGAPLGASLALLDQKQRPFNVLLVGDSTGVDPEGWNVRLMDWLGKKTGRPWEMRAWHQQPHEVHGPPGYFPPWQHAGGPNAKIVLWNASAGGQGFDYTMANKAKMVPPSMPTIDLLLVNHGHNVRPGSTYRTAGYAFLEELHKRFPKMPAVIFKQNPEKGGSLERTQLPAVFFQIDRFASQHPGVTVIDVYRTFQDTGKPKDLIDDTNFHPTKPGYQMWFERVRKEFVKARPALA